MRSMYTYFRGTQFGTERCGIGNFRWKHKVAQKFGIKLQFSPMSALYFNARIVDK